MDESVSFGSWIKARRQALGLTQAELARRAGCATVTIRKIEQDERRPSRQVAERLAVALELPLSEREAFVKGARAEWGMDRLAPTLGLPRRALGAGHPAGPRPAVRPTGTVTFLFTDLESSTRLWERHGQAMPGALARHDAILRETVAANQGTIVKQTGDGMHAVFARAADAIAAALAAQRMLQREAWGDVAVRVRMALHTGTADERDGDYYGPPVNRAARLLAVAHGGQILLSRATAELVEERLPPGVALRELGQHRLRDLARPEHIVQLVAPGLPANFPPLKTVDNHPTNLRLQRDPLIGRGKEMASVIELLAGDDVGLVTLTGPGGIGKTHLALRVAAELLPTFPDGVWFIDLAPISDPSLVASAIGITLNFEEVPGEPMAERLAAFLRDKQVLLVLDNFEQVVEAAPLVANLLTAARRLKVLATSRTALRVRGERLVAVPPLAVPDPRQPRAVDSLVKYAAVQLFLRRAQAVRPDLELTRDNMAAVAAICVRLDGLPLAIELAAARSGLLDPAALAARLAHPLQLLARGPRDLPARQQTLRDTIDWSYTLLDQGEQTLFRRLAVFVGGWNLPAAETVCNPAGDLGSEMLDELQSLLDKSLVRQVEQPNDEPRFTMLETIREYALEQVDGEVEELRRRHAAYYTALAEAAEPELMGARQASWLERLEAEHANLLAALRWSLEQGEVELELRLATALWRFWLVRGYPSEGRQWLEEGLTAAQGLGHSPVLARALGRAAALARVQGDYARAVEWYEESLALARALEDKRSIAFALNGLGAVADQQGDYARAVALYEESLAVSRELGAKPSIAVSLSFLGVAALEQGDYERAALLCAESLALRRELGDTAGMAIPLNALGWVALEQGDPQRSQTYFEESLALSQAAGNQGGVAIVLSDLGWVALEEQDYARAASLFGESLTLRQKLGDKLGTAQCLEGLAAVAGARGEAERAVRLWGAAEGIRAAIGAPPWPAERARYDCYQVTLRTQLGADSFVAARVAGRAMSVEQALSYARETLA